MNALKYAVKAALATYEPDGFTTPIFVHTPKRYAVSVTNNGARPDVDDLVNQASKALRELPPHLSNMLHVGGWTDSKTGNEYVDVGFTTDDIAEALAYCGKYDQLAAFDLKDFVEIRVKNEHEKAHM